MRVKLSVKLILLVVFAVMISAISSMTVSYFSVREGFNRLFSEFLSTNMLVAQGKIDQYVNSYKSLAVAQSGVSIEEAAKLSAQSGESLKHILEFVHMVNDQVQSIATASEQQSAVSEEINRSVEQVATISAETAQAMDQAFSAVAELAQQSHTLQRLIVEMKNG